MIEGSSETRRNEASRRRHRTGQDVPGVSSLSQRRSFNCITMHEVDVAGRNRRDETGRVRGKEGRGARTERRKEKKLPRERERE